MIMNDLLTVKEAISAWNDLQGDIGILLENVNFMLNGKNLKAKEREQLEELCNTLEVIQNCY